MRCCGRMLARCQGVGDRQDARQRSWLSSGAAVGGLRSRIAGVWSCAGGLEAMSAQDVVCQGEPEQGGGHFAHAADGELAQMPLAEASIAAFAHGSPLIDAFVV